MIIKNSKIRQYLSKNSYKILFGVIGIILLLLVLGTMSTVSKQQEQKEKNQIANTITNTSNVYKPQETVISGGNIPKEKQEKNSNIINKFVEYCNNGEIEKAYNLLTVECKINLYPNINSFRTNYVQKRFTKKRQADIQSYYNDIVDTYKVKLTEDILSTGNASMAGSVEEYMSIVTKNGEEKLNINNYIDRKEIGITGNSKNVNIELISKDTYLDYEIYNIQVTNNTNKKILLDSKQNTDTVYLSSRTGGIFRASIYEIAEESLTIGAMQTKKISIKFNKVYNPTLKISTMNFNNIIMDYNEYSNIQNKSNYKNINTIQIEL